MENRYFTELEVASRQTMRGVQTTRLREQVRHAHAHSGFYRRKMDEAGVVPDEIQELEDLKRLPFTTKDELKECQRERPPWGDILAVPFENCLRVHFTSGTTGRPVAVLDTPEDWRGFFGSYARGLYAMGIRPSDMVMTAFGFGPWIGFWSGFYAAQEIGCLVVPNGGLSTDQRIDLLINYPITVFGSTPSYALYLAEQARKKGIDLAKDSKVRITWHTGEPGASIPSTKRKIEEAFGAKCFDLPGLTEIAAWGFECEYQSGQIHIHEDYVYPEVLDPDRGEPVSPGETGELVFTSLYRKAMPLLRYRTRDIVKQAETPCPCGRTLLSLQGGILGRLDDMKKVRGIIVYPSRIEEAVRRFPEAEEFQIVFQRQDGLDHLLVKVDPSPALGGDGLSSLKEKLSEELHLALGIRASVEFVEPGGLPRWDHKARRVVDDRGEVPF